MSIEDGRRSRAAAPGTDGQQSPRTPGARDAGLERALEYVRQVAVEASDLLRREGLKPAKLVYVPRGARSYPLFGHAFSGVPCGYGWHVVRGVVVSTDGRLWARTRTADPTPQRDLDAWRLQVEPPDGPLSLPPPVEYDGVSLRTVRRIAEDQCLKVGLVDHLTDGYARLLIHHHRRRP